MITWRVKQSSRKPVGISDLRLGASVHSADGRRIGELARVIVEEDGFDLRAIVIREDVRFSGRYLAPGSWYLTDELIVPMGTVAAADRQDVMLNISAAEVRRQPAYLAHQYRSLSRTEVIQQGLAVATGGPAMPGLTETANKAPGEIAIDGGENVMLGRTGRKLGHVRDVLIDDGEVIGIVMRPEGFFEHDVLLPVRFLDRSDDMALFAQLDEADLEHLQPFPA